jgi:hypothetical protein
MSVATALPRIGDLVRMKAGHYPAGRPGIVVKVDERGRFGRPRVTVRFPDGTRSEYRPDELEQVANLDQMETS